MAADGWCDPKVTQLGQLACCRPQGDADHGQNLQVLQSVQCLQFTFCSAALGVVSGRHLHA